jgi:hypothetical protein
MDNSEPSLSYDIGNTRDEVRELRERLGRLSIVTYEFCSMITYADLSESTQQGYDAMGEALEKEVKKRNKTAKQRLCVQALTKLSDEERDAVGAMIDVDLDYILLQLK